MNVKSLPAVLVLQWREEHRPLDKLGTPSTTRHSIIAGRVGQRKSIDARSAKTVKAWQKSSVLEVVQTYRADAVLLGRPG